MICRDVLQLLIIFYQVTSGFSDQPEREKEVDGGTCAFRVTRTPANQLHNTMHRIYLGLCQGIFDKPAGGN